MPMPSVLAARARRSSTATASRILHPRLEGERDRIQALTDSVFAIAITLLVLDLKPPPVEVSALPSTLRGMVPMLLVYLLTFLVLGGMWFRHRTEFTYISRVDHPLAWLNLGLLGFVALVPWSASLVGQHPDAHLTVLVYNLKPGRRDAAAAARLAVCDRAASPDRRHATQAGPLEPAGRAASRDRLSAGGRAVVRQSRPRADHRLHRAACLYHRCAIPAALPIEPSMKAALC